MPLYFTLDSLKIIQIVLQHTATNPEQAIPVPCTSGNTVLGTHTLVLNVAIRVTIGNDFSV